MKTTIVASTGPVIRGLLALALVAGTAHDVSAQRRSAAAMRREGRVLEIGSRIGMDITDNVLVLGGHLRIPVDPWQRFELMPGFDFTFQSGLTERQLELDGAFFIDGARILYLGGGAAFRNTRYLENRQVLEQRETRTGYSVFAGLHGGTFLDALTTQIEFRWTFVDDFKPRTITLGFDYPIPLGF
ncbi:MAG TPA: hypothetical protein VE173_15710 [Longimicrobiales bacterium]|nr:hypothetical protein [Longimicrobiales bacterium]